MKYKNLYLTAASICALFVANVVHANGTKTAPKKPAHHHPHHCEDAASLRHQVAEMMKKIDQLEHQPRIREQEIVTHTPGNNVRLKIYGHVNRAAWWADNGRHSETQYVDNDNSSSRISFDASGDMNCDLTIGGVFEVEMLQNSTRNTDIRNSTSGTSAAFTARKAEVYAESKTFGKLYLGKGYMASYYTMFATDTSRTDVALEGAKVNDMANAVTFYDETTGAIATGLRGTQTALTVGKVFNPCDGLIRQDRVRYDSPTYAGFSLQGSHAYNTLTSNQGNDMWDVALKYECTFDGILTRAQIAYVADHTVQIFGTTKDSTIAYHQINGSAGVLFPCGISLMVAAADRDWEKFKVHDGKLLFGKIGYQHQFCEAGLTALGVDYGHYNNFIINTTTPDDLKHRHKGRTWGLGIVQFLDRVATELYLVGRNYELKVPGGDRFKDVKVVMGGARVKF